MHLHIGRFGGEPVANKLHGQQIFSLDRMTWWGEVGRSLRGEEPSARRVDPEELSTYNFTHIGGWIRKLKVVETDEQRLIV